MGRLKLGVIAAGDRIVAWQSIWRQNKLVSVGNGSINGSEAVVAAWRRGNNRSGMHQRRGGEKPAAQRHQAAASKRRQGGQSKANDIAAHHGWPGGLGNLAEQHESNGETRRRKQRQRQ
jgi:hypothetical protein